MRIYISGAITGVPDYMERFVKAEAKLREQFSDAELVNPAALAEVKPEKTWSDYMREDLKLLLACDTIAMLDGYERSRGAQFELLTAHTLGLRVLREQVKENSLFT